MDAIKKKMQAMKLEKDNAMDRADACEQQAKDANLRAERVIIFKIPKYILLFLKIYHPDITGSPRIIVPKKSHCESYSSSTVEKWVFKGKLNKGFLRFLPNFCHI